MTLGHYDPVCQDITDCTELVENIYFVIPVLVLLGIYKIYLVGPNL